jgi:hypothetical protein
MRNLKVKDLKRVRDLKQLKKLPLFPLFPIVPATLFIAALTTSLRALFRVRRLERRLDAAAV